MRRLKAESDASRKLDRVEAVRHLFDLDDMRLRLGARGSALSLAQATLVQRALGGEARVEIVTVRTTGDRLSAEGAPIGWKGDFTKELDEALLDGRDRPRRAQPQGRAVRAAGGPRARRRPRARGPARRARRAPAAATRGAPGRRARRHLEPAPPGAAAAPRVRTWRSLEARGNVDTRIRRLREGRWDAIVLARAGLARLGRLEEIVEVFAEAVLLPAVGAGGARRS